MKLVETIVMFLMDSTSVLSIRNMFITESKAHHNGSTFVLSIKNITVMFIMEVKLYFSLET